MIAVALLALSAALAPAEQAPLIRPGALTDPVRCDADPKLSYALYLPPRYAPERKWPILYVFDPRGRGRLAAELFRDVAERRGFIVASSNNTESDNPKAPNSQVIGILWEETHARLAIDEQRVYAAGFSGGARLACGLGYALKGKLTGVIGCGAGFPEREPPRRDMPFAYFGAVGNRDFNYYEMRSLEKELERLDLPARVVFFDGEHDWPPAEVAAEAVDWMEVLAMKHGRLPPEEAFAESVLRRSLEKARSLEERGRIAEAFARYQAVAQDLKGLAGVAEADAGSGRLRKAGVEEELRRREKRDRSDQGDIRRSLQVLAAIRSAEEPPPLARAMNELRIAELRKQAAGPTFDHDTMSAQRRLAHIFVEAAFYLPRALVQSGEYRRAALALQLATEVQAENPRVWYALARALARARDKKRALVALSRAVGLGFDDRERLQTDPDLEPIRDEAAFGQILESLGARGGPGNKP